MPRVFRASIADNGSSPGKRKRPHACALVPLRTAVREGCRFCIDADSAGGRMHGLSDDQAASIGERKWGAFPPGEQALIRMADAMADTPANVSHEL